MFNTKDKLALQETSHGTTIIGAGTVITGNIESQSDIRVDGSVIGNIFSKAKIVIGSEGQVQGDITGQQADISGKVTGKIQAADMLQLREKATVNGDIYAGKLQMEPTATFNGSCHMGANIVELNAEIAHVANS
jgi:cytoskeletal protein CcmA (bactofilin family)